MQHISHYPSWASFSTSFLTQIETIYRTFP